MFFKDALLHNSSPLSSIYVIVFVSLILWNSNTISNMDDIEDHEDEEVFCCSALLLTSITCLITFTLLLSRSWKIFCLDYFLFSHIHFAEHLHSKHQSLVSRQNVTCKLRGHFFWKMFLPLLPLFQTFFGKSGKTGSHILPL